MLDTKICIYTIKNRPRRVKEIFSKHDISEMAISSLIVDGLYLELLIMKAPPELEAALEGFMSEVQVIPFDEILEQRFKPLSYEIENGAQNMKVAAHALFLNAMFVTSNPADYSILKGKGLKLENWFEK
jgi:tRNA(fMet)-specific endonuclease VapC